MGRWQVSPSSSFSFERGRLAGNRTADFLSHPPSPWNLWLSDWEFAWQAWSMGLLLGSDPLCMLCPGGRFGRVSDPRCWYAHVAVWQGQRPCMFACPRGSLAGLAALCVCVPAWQFGRVSDPTCMLGPCGQAINVVAAGIRLVSCLSPSTSWNLSMLQLFSSFGSCLRNWIQEKRIMATPMLLCTVACGWANK